MSVAEQPLDLELLGTVVEEYQVEARVGAVRIGGERLSAGVTADVVPGRHPRRRHVTDGGPPPRLLDLGAAGHVVATSFAAHEELPVQPVL